MFRQISIYPIIYVTKMPPTKGGICFLVLRRHSQVAGAVNIQHIRTNSTANRAGKAYIPPAVSVSLISPQGA